MKEKLAGLAVKMKEHKGLVIGILVAVLVVIVALIAVFAMKPSYKSTVKNFAKACQDEKKMEKFVDKYVDLRALYAMRQCEDPEDFKEEYKKAKKSDYKDEEFVEDVKDAFKNFVSEDEKIKVKKIGKLEKNEDCKEITEAKVTFVNPEDADEELDMKVLFYKGKMLMMTFDY